MFLMLKYPKEANLTVISNTLWSLIDEEGEGGLDWNSRSGWKIDEKCILLNSFKHGFKNYKYILFVMSFWYRLHIMKLNFRANFLVLLTVVISAMKCSPFTVDICSYIQNDNSKCAHVWNWWDEILLQCQGFFYNFFCTKAMFTLENVLNGKKT